MYINYLRKVDRMSGHVITWCHLPLSRRFELSCLVSTYGPALEATEPCLPAAIKYPARSARGDLILVSNSTLDPCFQTSYILLDTMPRTQPTNRLSLSRLDLPHGLAQNLVSIGAFSRQWWGSTKDIDFFQKSERARSPVPRPLLGAHRPLPYLSPQ